MPVITTPGCPVALMRSGPTIIRLVPSSPALIRVIAWAGAALFVASLGYFLFTYTFTFGRIATGSVVPGDLVWNLSIFTVFALHHSVLARSRVREAVARTVPPGLERSLYVWIASLLLILVCWWWHPVPGVVWRMSGRATWVLYAIQLAGIWLTIRSAAIIDVRELAGLTPANSLEPGARDGSSAIVFKTCGPYGRVRHPIYAGWFLIVFAVPLMTMTRLEFAVVSGLYLLIAIPLEERTLAATAGEAYIRYASRVRWKLLPGIF
jgi:protein-S-isoprenylcysteine O-methyltransferase Ste14